MLAKREEKEEAEKLLIQATEKLKKAIDLGDGSYSLACAFSLRKLKSEALELLEISLTNEEITTEFVLADEDWKSYKEDDDFIAIVEKYKS